MTSFLIFFFLFPLNAYAYLDPGAGSMLLQLVMAGGAGVFLLVKIVWRTLQQKFLSKNGK